MRCWPRPCRRKQRGWALVLVGGLGAVGGYLAASALSAWLQPLFGWRILWFLNLPTGLIADLPQRLRARVAEVPAVRSAASREAHAVLRSFGCTVRDLGVARSSRRAARSPTVGLTVPHSYVGPHLGPQHCRARLGPDQLRPAAVDAGAARRQGLQRGALEPAARRLGAHRGADGVRRRLALRPLEQQGGAGRLDRVSPPSACSASSISSWPRRPTPARCCRSQC